MSKTGITIAQLQHFIYTVKLGSYALAAKKLLLSSQAVAKSVHKLESQLNVKVFYYRSRTLHLTVEGVEVLRYAQDIMRNMHKLNKIGKSSDKNNIQFKNFRI